MNISDNTVMAQVIAAALIFLIVYHHLGYPLMLKALSTLRLRNAGRSTIASRNFRNCVGDRRVPKVHLYIPAYNEEAYIYQKLTSLSWLDYPKDKLKITVLCDGCSDQTAARARSALTEFSLSELDIRVVEYPENRGKIAMVNEAIQQCDADIMAFSDVSAVLAADCFWRMAHHFMCHPNVGVVTGHYSVIKATMKPGGASNSDGSSSDGTSNEQAYWNYQNQIRAMEGSLGAVMGAPGAFYAIRHHLCQPLEFDTINDDFILPMRGVAQGFNALFDPELQIFETEPSDMEMDAQRRIRISQGNMQQILRLKRLLLPDLGWASWMFTSGKFLRVLMPYCMLAVLLLSAWLAPHHWFWALTYLLQVAVYVLAAAYYLTNAQAHNSGLQRLLNHKLVRLVSYLCIGHFMGLIGSAKYLLNTLMNKKQQPW